jgi:hypothetical protein
MKSITRFITVSIALAFYMNSEAQVVWGLKMGYNMNFVNMDGVNTVVDRYNSTYTNLDQELGYFNYLDGFSYHITTVWGFIDAGYDNRSKSQTAIFTANGRRYEEEIRLGLNTAHIALALPIILTEDRFTYINFGTSLNFGQLKLRSRTALEGNLKESDWEEVYSGSYMDMELNFRFTTQGFTIEPYYGFSLDGLMNEVSNMYLMNRALNPDTYQLDGADVPIRYRAFGIRLMFTILTTSADYDE